MKRIVLHNTTHKCFILHNRFHISNAIWEELNIYSDVDCDIAHPRLSYWFPWNAHYWNTHINSYDRSYTKLKKL